MKNIFTLFSLLLAAALPAGIYLYSAADQKRALANGKVAILH